MFYYPLGIITDYTLLNSLIKVDDLIIYCNNNNINCIGILNDNLNSTMEFYTKCLQNNIKPIVGLIKKMNNLEYYVYPKNYVGLIELFNGVYVSDNLISVIPPQSIELYNNINGLKYLSYTNKDELKKSLTVTNNVIYINKVYSLTKEDVKYVNYLHMIDKGLTISNYDSQKYDNNYLINNSDKFDSNTTKLFSDLIDIKIINDKKYIPKFIDNSYEYLKALCVKGLTKRLGNINDIYKKRVIYELDVIEKLGYVDYFLIVYDYVKFAKKNNIMVGPGRGSAAGSLVAYSLGITEVDPIKYELLFERFLNPERVTMPDIDIDFDAFKRGEVIEYVKNKYGNDYVSGIMTYSTLSSKQVLRDVAKCLEIDSNLIDKLVSLIDAKTLLKDNLNNSVKSLINQYSNIKNAYYISMKLEGLKRQVGTHAAGIVISSEKLTKIVPIIKSGDVSLTGYTMEYLENLGLLKMDFLAIKDLSILDDILHNINENININKIPLDDELTYDSFKNADTSGVFQFESIGMKNFLIKLKPDCFDDLVAALALFRPGPMANIDNYIKRKEGKEKIDYIDVSLKSILKPTYGIIVYQEQIMQILSKMAKYSFAEADLIRRAISKKKLKIIEEERIKFVSNSIKNNYSEEISNRVYDLIIKFANYGFNKSHSVAYALVGYQMCYLKTHYPEYFYTSLLNFNIGSESKTKEYLDCLKKLNINISKPNVNLSEKKYVVKNNIVILPINTIKNIGISVVDVILNERKDGYNDYFDFIKRINCNGVGKKTFELLINSGSMDTFNLNRKTMIENLNNAINYSELSGEIEEYLISKPNIIYYDDYNDNEYILMEKEIFGFYISNHPVTKYNNLVKLNEIDKYFDKFINIFVSVDEIKKIKTKKNEDMAFLVCSDETSKLDFIVFSNKFNLINDIKIGDIVQISGHTEKRLNKYQIIVNNIKKDL